MPKVMIIECSDEEADRLVEQIKDIVTEHKCQPFREPGKVYEFELLRILSKEDKPVSYTHLTLPTKLEV